METRKTTKRASAELSASVADLASVSWINSFYGYSLHCCFVLDEVLQLVERPVAYPVVHCSSSSLFSYSFEFFHDDLVTVEVGDNFFADVVVYPSHVTSFSSTDLLEKTFCGSSAFGLEFASQVFEFSFCLLDFVGVEELAVACDCQVVYSEVNAKNTFLRSVVDSIDLFGKSEQEECSSFFIHSKQAFSNLPSEVFLVASRDVELECLSGFEKSENQCVSFDVCASGKVVSDTGMLYDWLAFGLLDYSASSLNARNSELTWQGFSDVFVDERMEFDIVFDSFFPCSVYAVLECFCESFNSPKCFWCGSDPDFCCDDASHSSCELEQVFKTFGGWQFLPRINPWVSLPYAL